MYTRIHLTVVVCLLHETKTHGDRCQVVAPEDAATQIAQILEPNVTAAAREGAEGAVVGDKGGRDEGGGGGTLGAGMSWLLAPFSCLLKGSPASWRCEDLIVVHAAHLVCGGSDEITRPDFVGVSCVLCQAALLRS